MATASITITQLQAMLNRATAKYELAWDEFVESSAEDTDGMCALMEKADLIESHASYIKYVLDYAQQRGMIEFIPEKWMLDMLGL